MPPMNQKNVAISLAGDDLGLVDNVRQKLSDQETERRKKLLQLSKASPFGPATIDLMGQQLMGVAQ